VLISRKKIYVLYCEARKVLINTNAFYNSHKYHSVHYEIEQVVEFSETFWMRFKRILDPLRIGLDWSVKAEEILGN
jgi:hypothetical protein